MTERRSRKRKITFDDTCFLVSEGLTGRDSLGNKITERKETEVFCNINSVDRSQFYDASARGYKPSFVITINDFEYSNQNKVRLNNVDYEVIRTYLLDGGLIELTIGEKIGDRVWLFMKCYKKQD